MIITDLKDNDLLMIKEDIDFISDMIRYDLITKLFSMILKYFLS